MKSAVYVSVWTCFENWVIMSSILGKMIENHSKCFSLVTWYVHIWKILTCDLVRCQNILITCQHVTIYICMADPGSPGGCANSQNAIYISYICQKLHENIWRPPLDPPMIWPNCSTCYGFQSFCPKDLIWQMTQLWLSFKTMTQTET